jgi:hypothetical protein
LKPRRREKKAISITRPIAMAKPFPDVAGAGATIEVQMPTLSGRLHCSRAPAHSVSQQTPSVQWPVTQRASSSHNSPIASGVLVAVDVAVGVGVGVEVGVDVGVAVDVGVTVGVAVGVVVGVVVGVDVGVPDGVEVGVAEGVDVGVNVGVAVGVGVSNVNS